MSELPFGRPYDNNDGEDGGRGADDGATDASLTSVPLGLEFLSSDVRGDVDLAAVDDFEEGESFV